LLAAIAGSNCWQQLSAAIYRTSFFPKLSPQIVAKLSPLRQIVADRRQFGDNLRRQLLQQFAQKLSIRHVARENAREKR
jgi:hypothetical protein